MTIQVGSKDTELGKGKVSGVECDPVKVDVAVAALGAVLRARCSEADIGPVPSTSVLVLGFPILTRLCFIFFVGAVEKRPCKAGRGLQSRALTLASPGWNHSRIPFSTEGEVHSSRGLRARRLQRRSQKRVRSALSNLMIEDIPEAYRLAK